MTKTHRQWFDFVFRLSVMKSRVLSSLLAAAGCYYPNAFGAEGKPGIFERESEVGNPAKAGSAEFDSATKQYLVAGGGANIWSTNDAFHFVWKRLSGDFVFQSGIEWPSRNDAAPHRKACLMVRQTLEPDSPYVDVAVHGSGLTSLQWREQSGGDTREVRANVDGPVWVELERQHDVFFVNFKRKGGLSENSGAYTRVKFADPVYVGLAVCAHDDRAIEKASFSSVTLHKVVLSEKPELHCTLETVDIRSKDRQAIYHTPQHIEAPNWSRDGQYFIFNSDGHILQLRVGGGEPERVDTGFANHCNNDHGLSPDGKLLAISDQTKEGKSLIYVLPSAGGIPRQLTVTGPSYWHGWSPDGSTLAFCGQRNEEFDVYTIPVNGGPEQRLTTAKGLDDGPDYTADGKFIYFNSERTGSMQIWRMKSDGSSQEKITADEFNNWFPHPSPDGKWLVFLSYEKGVVGHPANQTVRLRLMPMAGGPVQELAKFFGGQGTINVPSWSPDSQKVAFVSYELLAAVKD